MSSAIIYSFAIISDTVAQNAMKAAALDTSILGAELRPRVVETEEGVLVLLLQPPHSLPQLAQQLRQGLGGVGHRHLGRAIKQFKLGCFDSNSIGNVMINIGAILTFRRGFSLTSSCPGATLLVVNNPRPFPWLGATFTISSAPIGSLFNNGGFIMDCELKSC